MATVQALVLKFQSLSSRENGAPQTWSCRYHLSGQNIPDTLEGDNAALGLWAPISQMVESSTELTGWLHYPANSSVNDLQNTFVPGTHTGTGTAWLAHESVYYQQVEVCALLRAPTVPNAKGRMGYLFKYIHDVPTASVGAPGNQELAIANPGLFDSYSTGIDARNRIPVSPAGVAPTQKWTLEPYLVTRQMRRGAAPKP
jgi:hypothetical protein